MELDAKVSFAIAEHKALRDEVVLNSKSRVQSVLYTIAANASVLAFLTSDVFRNSQLRGLLPILGWIPLLLTVAGYFYYYESVRNIARIAEYIKLLELRIAQPEYGWEHYVSEHRSKNIFRARYVYNLVFLLQIFFSVIVGLAVSGLISR